MLNITRRRGERIVVGDDIFVSVLEISGQTVRLGIDAPRAVRVYREEIWLEVKAQNEAAAAAAAASSLPEGGQLPSLKSEAAPADAPEPPGASRVNRVRAPDADKP